MTEPCIYGHTSSGRPITDTEIEIEAIADEAEVGYDVDELIDRRGKRGRLALGSSPVPGDTGQAAQGNSRGK